MKIPDDVTITFEYLQPDLAEKDVHNMVRHSGSFPWVHLWFSGDQFLLISEENRLAEGKFTRTVKTCRVIWADSGRMLRDGHERKLTEEFILKHFPTRSEKVVEFEMTDGWIVRGHDREGYFSWRGFGFTYNTSLAFKIDESVEEIPWSPFDAAKKGSQ